MLASLVDAPLDDPQLVYEPKYDGIRAIAEISTGGRARLWSRLGNEKTRQFPEIVAALNTWARRLHEPVVLDGEIVALDDSGEPAGFQRLQGRINVSQASEATSGAGRVAYIVFDILRRGRRDLRDRPLLERRAELDRIFRGSKPGILRLSEFVRGDGRALYEQALSRGWEGLIAKDAGSVYASGKRSPDWRKLKIVQEQEFVVGGWTEPRHTRTYFGALLLGVYDGRDLVYVGHTGTGFDERELARLMKLLKPLETSECPFRDRPRTNERPHWVQPRIVAQVRFTEWTADAKLRHPVYLGLRDDKKPEDVRREPTSRLPATPAQRQHRNGNPGRPQSTRRASGRTSVAPLIDQLRAIEESRRDGVIELPDGDQLNVTNLHKVFWPGPNRTKGDLLRYYVHVAPFILPVVENRALVMKRLPNGITGKAFYQQRAPEDVPEGVRVERVRTDREVPSRIIGGNLKTLLYMAQLAAISQDPWFSRVDSPESADHAALDLDPAPGVEFERVLDVARWIRDELDAIGAIGVPKTSGARGLHIYIPLPPATPYDAGQLFCQIIATVVTHKHPRIATVERAVRARGRRVYIDYLQNIPGKTLASAYSARASDYAGVSTPVSWSEIEGGIRREDFTLDTVPPRLQDVGDLWKTLRTSKGVDLARVERYAKQRR